MQDNQGDDIAATALHAGDEASATPHPTSRAAGIVHVVIGSNGENRIRAEGVMCCEAWRRALDQAAEVGNERVEKGRESRELR